MLIDWFTVAAQALNFLVLIWLLQRFLYKPILSAVDARESRIATQLADAATKAADAQKLSAEFQHKTDAFDKARAGMLDKATDEAKAERQRLMEEAGKAADALAAARQETMRGDAEGLNTAIGRKTQDSVFAIARSTLTDLASASLDERMVDVFIQRLGDLDVPSKDLIGAALTSAKDPALLRSAFDLPPAERAKIENALNVTFAADIALRFETAPELIAGIELSANGQKISWSIANYLTSLERGVRKLVGTPGDAAAPKNESKIEIKLALKAL